MSANDMKPKRTNHVAQIRAEYDFDYSKAVRGKYYKRLLAEGSNVVVLDRDGVIANVRASSTRSD
jgi:hypothetical protein